MMTLPNVTTGKIVDENGMMTKEFQDFLVHLMLYLQTNLSNEGSISPPLTNAQIAVLTKALNGTLVYNSDTKKLMGKQGGVGITGGSFVNLV